VKPGDLSQAQSTPAPVPEAQTVLTHVTGVNDWSPAPEVLGLQLKELRRDAWGRFIQYLGGRIYVYIMGFGLDRDTSEELTQETFLRAFCAIGGLRDTRRLYGWMYRIAANLAKRRLREIMIMRGSMSVPDMSVPDLGTSILSALVDREDIRKVRRAINQLPSKSREAMILHYVASLSIPDAAKAAGVSKGTLKSRLNRGLEAVRKACNDGSED